MESLAIIIGGGDMMCGRASLYSLIQESRSAYNSSIERYTFLRKATR